MSKTYGIPQFYSQKLRSIAFLLLCVHSDEDRLCRSRYLDENRCHTHISL